MKTHLNKIGATGQAPEVKAMKLADTFVRTAVRYPGACFALVLALMLPTAYFGIAGFSLSDPEGGQLVRDSPEAEAAHAFLRAADLAGSQISSQTRVPQQTELATELKLYYVAGSSASDDARRDQNVLSVANIAKMAALEDELVASAHWQEVPTTATCCYLLLLHHHHHHHSYSTPGHFGVPTIMDGVDSGHVRLAHDFTCSTVATTLLTWSIDPA